MRDARESRVGGIGNNDSSPECEGSERSWSPSTVHENYATGRGRSADLFLLSDSDGVKRVRHEEIVKVVLDRVFTSPARHRAWRPHAQRALLVSAHERGASGRVREAEDGARVTEAATGRLGSRRRPEHDRARRLVG